MASAPGYNLGDGPVPFDLGRDRSNLPPGETRQYVLGNPPPPDPNAPLSRTAQLASGLRDTAAVGTVLSRLPRSHGAAYWSNQEKKLSAEGLDTVYGRGGPTTRSALRTGDYHIQPSGDKFARQMHLVSERHDPTLPEHTAAFGPVVAAGPHHAGGGEVGPVGFIPETSYQPANMMGNRSPEDYLHRQSTAGSGGNFWLGEDAQHSTLTSGINTPPVRPIRYPVGGD